MSPSARARVGSNHRSLELSLSFAVASSMSLVRLVSFAVPMLAATLVASFTPLWTPLSAKKIQIISTYATGLLVGAALTVIIPEGVEAVYDNRGKGHDDGEEGEMAGWIGGALLAGFILM